MRLKKNKAVIASEAHTYVTKIACGAQLSVLSIVGFPSEQSFRELISNETRYQIEELQTIPVMRHHVICISEPVLVIFQIRWGPLAC